MVKKANLDHRVGRVPPYFAYQRGVNYAADRQLKDAHKLEDEIKSISGKRFPSNDEMRKLTNAFERYSASNERLQKKQKYDRNQRPLIDWQHNGRRNPRVVIK